VRISESGGGSQARHGNHQTRTCHAGRDKRILKAPEPLAQFGARHRNADAPQTIRQPGHGIPVALADAFLKST
jgi:hypothetical protein